MAALKVLAGVVGLLLIAAAAGPVVAIIVGLGLIVGLFAVRGR